jgi:hypothetical protein
VQNINSKKQQFDLYAGQLQASINTTNLGESRGLVVKDEDSRLSDCGFESRRRILDGVSKASCYIEKGSQMGHTKKNYLKNPKKNTLPI